ncbi:MAG: serine--tRNA ligase [Gemmatimonadetes bacterium]|nr:MAG: serine--tRNA ligase [Gemmatimonadota bacterium]PYP53791.1 MAG: serine--tRNA ligase [Gemmatimonadota bacterium]
MHDLRMVREHIDALRAGMRRRGVLDALSPTIDRAVALDKARRETIQAVEERKAARNAVSQQVGQRKRAGESADDLQQQSRLLGDEIARLDRELAQTEGELSAILLELPNITLDQVPAGGEDKNAVVRSWGAPRDGARVQPHWEIGAKLGIIDFERGAKISGSGFIVFREMGARLVRALMNLMLDVHSREHGYQETWVPVVVNRASMTGTAQLPKFEEDMYALRDEDAFLIPTAEVPLTNLYRDEIIPESELPKSFTACSPCFRREAGAAGKDTRGLLRVHEFDKVELVRYVTPESSEEQLELLTGHAEQILTQLDLPYRVVRLASGDTGFASAHTYDLETFAPGVGKWLEVSSCSNFTDFQARRANIRYKPSDGGKPRFVHTLNGSGLAFPRVIASILEHHQQEDGSVRIPAALSTYLGAERLG